MRKYFKMSSKGSLLCYNRGCGQRFDPDENRDGISYEFKLIDQLLTQLDFLNVILPKWYCLQMFVFIILELHFSTMLTKDGHVVRKNAQILQSSLT